jgi:pimeloyl-ACP methyl ester carboxylesterase
MLFVAVLLSTIALLLVAGILYESMGARSDAAQLPPPGRMIDIGGSRLHLHDMGEGTPAVVFESGIAATSLSWRHVMSEVAGFTKVCSYDRAGFGWSDAAVTPRTPAHIVEELSLLLRNAGISPPYILVGHSFGALVVRLFAARYRGDVAGVVLVDPLSPFEWCPLTEPKAALLARGIKLSRRGKLLARVGVVRLCVRMLSRGHRFVPRLAARVTSGNGSEVLGRLAEEIRKLPREVWPIVASHWCKSKCFDAMMGQLKCLPRSAAEVASVEIPGDLRVVRIIAANSPRSSMESSSNTTTIVARKSGHWVQLDEPAVVVEAIRAMVHANRPV